MTPERWREVGELFDPAVRVDPAGRESWLRAACGGDDELCVEVGRLLAQDEAKQGTTEAPPNGTDTTNPSPAHGASQEDELRTTVAALNQRLGRFNISGDLRFRTQANFNRGLDQEAHERNIFPMKIRLRLQIGEKFSDHLDWAVGSRRRDRDHRR